MGTVQVWAPPVNPNVHVTVLPDAEQFDGRAPAADPASARVHSAENPAATANSISESERREQINRMRSSKDCAGPPRGDPENDTRAR